MASTAWMSRPASEKQVAFIQKMADEKIVSGLHDELLDRLADVASGQGVSGGEASELIDALMAAPRKAKPSAGFAPLISTQGERKAAATAAWAESHRLEAAAAEALVAAGGKAGVEGACTNCGHSAHDDKICGHSQFVSLGWDDGYNVVCECKNFVAVTAAQGAARTAHWEAQCSRDAAHKAEDAAREFERGDHVVVARGRKVPKGSKGQIIKVDEGNYGWRVFLLLADGSKAWIALSNIDHEEV